jgi:hypothetical protein
LIGFADCFTPYRHGALLEVKHVARFKTAAPSFKVKIALRFIASTARRYDIGEIVIGRILTARHAAKTVANVLEPDEWSDVVTLHCAQSQLMAAVAALSTSAF